MIDPVLGSAGDVANPAANTNAVVTYTADTTSRHVIGGVAWSYSAAPTGGSLQITSGGTVIFGPIAITAAGAGVFYFGSGKAGFSGQDITITLAAGGGGVLGNVSAITHWKM